MTRTASALIVGNEILTGKIEDRNTSFLGRELFGLGIRLERVVICPDEIERIARELNALRSEHDFCFTSGGVGPTHDDITIDAVAAAFDVPLLRSPDFVLLIQEHFGEKTTEEHLRMANVPRGATLVRNGKLRWPTIRMENVFVLPGVPELFRAKFEGLREQLDVGHRFFSEAVYTRCDEGEIAALLNRLTEAHPSVTIGSYVRFDDPEYHVKLTLDGLREDHVHAATEALVEALPPGDLVRRERR